MWLYVLTDLGLHHNDQSHINRCQSFISVLFKVIMNIDHYKEFFQCSLSWSPRVFTSFKKIVISFSLRRRQVLINSELIVIVCVVVWVSLTDTMQRVFFLLRWHTTSWSEWSYWVLEQHKWVWQSQEKVGEKIVQIFLEFPQLL